MTTARLTSAPSRLNPGSTLRRLLGASVGRSHVAAGDVLLAVIAAVVGYFVATTSGVKPAGGTAAGIGMVLVALPVLARRPMPVAGLGALLLADLANVAAFGEHTRCGAVLPVAAYLVFVACRRAPDARGLVLPLSAATGIGATTAAFELGAGGIFAITLVLGGAAVAARVVRRRDLVAEQLDRESQALQAQRDQTARLAVETERARIGGDLGRGVQEHVAALLEHAHAGRTAQDPVSAFEAIEQESRAGLSHMRAVLTELRPAATVEPAPTLAELDALLRTGRERATLRVDGERHALAPGVELAACRIVELLLGVIDPGDRGVQVQVRYAGDSLEVDLTAGGHQHDTVGQESVLAAARTRAAVVGGSVDLRARGGQTRARVLLPASAGA